MSPPSSSEELDYLSLADQEELRRIAWFIKRTTWWMTSQRLYHFLSPLFFHSRCRAAASPPSPPPCAAAAPPLVVGSCCGCRVRRSRTGPRPSIRLRVRQRQPVRRLRIANPGPVHFARGARSRVARLLPQVRRVRRLPRRELHLLRPRRENVLP